MKSRQDVLTDHTSAVYVENEIEISWLIKSGVIYDENKIKQRCDWSYKSGLHWKWIWNIVTNQSDRVRSTMKTKQENNVTNHKGAIYIEIDTKLLWPIRPDANCDEN